jgi:uncharacterized protein YciW
LTEKVSFLDEAPANEAKEAAFAEDRDADAYVNNWTRLWCWRPDLLHAFAELRLSDDATAAQIIAGAPAPALSEREAALADWARQVVRDPNATTERNVARLRQVGLGDQEIFEATAFVAFRLAFSAINDALGAAPDKQLADAAPVEVRAAVDYGRAPALKPST